MKREKIWIERSERSFLKDVLPLETPFSIQVEAIKSCNFKCIYCVYSLKERAEKKYEILTLDCFKKFTEDMKKFPKKLKALIFSGMGEPLLNNQLSEMISLSKQFAEKVIVISNGALLNEELSHKIVDAGLDEIRFSLQGLNSEDYLKTCGTNLDFNKFISNIKYLYENKKQCAVYVKMPDICVETEEKKTLFHNIFDDICDGMSIQAIVPFQNEVDYSKIKKDFDNTIYNDSTVQDVKVCPQPFYSMQLTANGSFRPCCSIESNCPSIGNLKQESVIDIWSGSKLRELRMAHLNGFKDVFPACKNCNYIKYVDNKYDNIDTVAELLKDKY